MTKAATEAPEAEMSELLNAFRASRAQQAKSGKSHSRAQRKAKEKKVQAAVDGRSLRATGRTEQLNVTIRPDLKIAITEYVKAEGIKIVDLVEQALEKEIGLRGI